MTNMLTAAQMQILERAAIESGQVTGLELMERAGRGVVEAIFETWPGLAQTSGRAVVLCGPGNNGGDGFVIARIFREWGWDVDVYLYGDAEKLPADARANYDRWRMLGRCENLTEAVLDDCAQKHPETLLVIDALFGTGLTRPVVGLSWVMAVLSAWRHETSDGKQPHVVCVDLPSGICADSGRCLGQEDGGLGMVGDLTVTFHSAKLGHYLADGPAHCSRLAVVDIGLPVNSEVGSAAAEKLISLCGQKEPDRVYCRGVDVAGLPNLQKQPADHKYSHGHALVLTGGPGKTGAARLAARAALRVGSGLVTLGVPPAAQLEIACHITAIMQTRIPDAGGLAELLQDRRLNALCLGPGLGTERARSLVGVALSVGRGTVLDADALTAFADDPDILLGMVHEKCVLTPHGGEFSRLFPDIAEKLRAAPAAGPAYSKVDAARDAAARAGCVVLFKGADTVIAAPDGRCSVVAAHYHRAAPWLATAGAGDVLAGIITGLLARGFNALQAAETAAWLHVECARAFGPGLISEDLPEQLPNVLKQLEI